MKKAKKSELRAEEVRHICLGTSRLVSRQIWKLSEERRTNFFFINTNENVNGNEGKETMLT